jgi:hypothetical protein
VIRKQRNIMKPQDILILLKLIVIGQRDWIYEELASELFMSKSEIHAGIKICWILKSMTQSLLKQL